MAELVQVLLVFTKPFAKTSTATKGDKTTVTANVILNIREDVQDHYNIPKAPDGTGTGGRQLIKEYTWTKIKDFADATGKVITVPEYERSASAVRSAQNVVRLRHATLKTKVDGTKPRTASIRFPGFFNLIMISQALGSMIKTNNPGTFTMDRTGKSYPLVLNNSTGVFAGYFSGAWVATAPVTATNADESSAVGETTVVTANKARG